MSSSRDFEWDEAKAASNEAKHGVRFDYAARVFLDGRVVTLDVTQEHQGESRRKAVGQVDGRIFAVVYIERQGVTRIISARRCNEKEAKAYGPA